MRREKKAGKPLPWSEHYLQNHITKSSREEVANGNGEPVFVNSTSKRVLEEYLNGMKEKYGSETASHPIGDLEIWGKVAKRSNNRGFLGLGDASDPGYLITGQSSTSRATSLPLGAASTDEIRVLKEEMEKQKEEMETQKEEMERPEQESKTREEMLRNEIVELHKRDLAREEELRASQEAAKSEMDAKFHALKNDLLLSLRVQLPPPA